MLLQQEEEEKLQFNQLVTLFNDKITNIEEVYLDIKKKEEIRQKNLELEQERLRKEKLQEQEELFENLKKYYSDSIDDINIKMENQKKQLDKYNDEQEKLLKELEFQKEEEKRAKHENIKKLCTIAEYNEMIVTKKDTIEK